MHISLPPIWPPDSASLPSLCIFTDEKLPLCAHAASTPPLLAPCATSAGHTRWPSTRSARSASVKGCVLGMHAVPALPPALPSLPPYPAHELVQVCGAAGPHLRRLPLFDVRRECGRDQVHPWWVGRLFDEFSPLSCPFGYGVWCFLCLLPPWHFVQVGHAQIAAAFATASRAGSTVAGIPSPSRRGWGFATAVGG